MLGHSWRACAARRTSFVSAPLLAGPITLGIPAWPRANDFGWQATRGVDEALYREPARSRPTGFPSCLTNNATIAWPGIGAYSIMLRGNSQSINALALDTFLAKQVEGAFGRDAA
jgi:hypothetical protein